MSRNVVGGSGLNAGRNISKNPPEEDYPEDVHLAAQQLLKQAPEMIISKNVRVTGVVTFKRLFRIDGNVDATFSAPPEASLIVGAHGTVTGDISGMNTVLIEGTVNGDIGVKTVSLKSSAVINGDIRCRYIEIEPKAVVKGNVYVMSDEEYLQTLPVVEPEMPPPPVKTIMLIVDPQVDHLSTGARPVAGAEDDAKRVADYITQKAHDIDEIFITLESRHRMHITHPVYWLGETGEHPLPNTIISTEDINNGVWVPVKPANLAHAVSYTQALEEQGNIHQLIITPEHCLIGTTGHAVIPSINNAVQAWTELTGKPVKYVMKGMNASVEMYSALSADVPVDSDPSTYADNELIASLNSGDRIIVCGQPLSHAVNYTVRDLIKLLAMYQRQFNKKAVEESLNPILDVTKKIYLLKDGGSAMRGYEDLSNSFCAYLANEGGNIVTCAEMMKVEK